MTLFMTTPFPEEVIYLIQLYIIKNNVLKNNEVQKNFMTLIRSTKEDTLLSFFFFVVVVELFPPILTHVTKLALFNRL
jgi:hypothetical protein